MEPLYIGNATRQMLDFQYRTGRNAPVRAQPIPPGAQVKISGDLSAAQIAYIVDKHAKYGVVNAEEIGEKGFHGTCYSVGKPITGQRLALLMDRNLDALIVQGREIREQSAVAQNNMLEQALAENGRPERMTELEVTIQQENEDGMRIRRDGQVPGPTRGRGGKRKAA